MTTHRAPAIGQTWYIFTWRLQPSADGQNGTRDRRQFLLGRFRRNTKHRTLILDIALLSPVSLAHSGMFPCLRLGTPTRFELANRSALISHSRVMRGSITSSMYPRDAA